MKRMLLFLLVVGGAGYYGYHKYYRPADARTGGTPATNGQAIAGQETPAAAPADGYALLAAGKAKEAAAAFEALVPKLESAGSAELPKALYHLGVAYAGMNNPTSAVRSFTRLVDKFPKDPNTGNAMVQLGRLETDPQKQSDWFARALAEFPHATELGAVSYDLGNKLLDAGKEIEGWKALTAAMFSTLTSDQRQKTRKRLEEMVKKHLFSKAPTPGSTEYVVKSGDTLGRISKETGVEVGMIRRANGMKADNIYPDQRLKIVPGKWAIDVCIGQFRLTVLFEGKWVRDFNVGVGNPEASPTPIGKFSIKDKLIDPPWKNIPHGDPRNILGTRWMGLAGAPSYGIHGTTQPDTIGKPLSAGCVRMLNEDVEVLYDLVPIGTEVTIRE